MGYLRHWLVPQIPRVLCRCLQCDELRAFWIASLEPRFEADVGEATKLMMLNSDR